jgi:hypothetical protein
MSELKWRKASDWCLESNKGGYKVTKYCDDGLQWLLTSVRRSMSVLTEADALVKLETKRDGAYGRPEFEWELAASQEVLAHPCG